MTKNVSQNFLLDRLGNDLMTEKIFVSSEPSAKFGKRACTKCSKLNNVNPHTPVAQKIADQVVFRRSQGEGVEFF